MPSISHFVLLLLISHNVLFGRVFHATAAPIGYQDLLFGPTIKEMKLHCSLAAIEDASRSTSSSPTSSEATESEPIMTKIESTQEVQDLEIDTSACEANRSHELFTTLASGHGTLVFQLLGNVFYGQGPADVEGGYLAYDPLLQLSTTVVVANSTANPQQANVSASVSQWQRFIENVGPARSLLGSSLAVLCDPIGYANRSVTNSVITMSNLTQICASGDFSSLAAQLGSSPSVSQLTTSYYRHHLRGSVFAVSWDRAMGAEAFPTAVSNTTVGRPDISDTILYEQVFCPNPIPAQVPIPPIPSLVNGLPRSLNTWADAEGTVLHVGNTFNIVDVNANDCRRVATRVGVAIVVMKGSSTDASNDAANVDIVVNSAVVVCEPVEGSFTKTSRSRPTHISYLRPDRPHRPTERTVAASSFSFASSHSTPINENDNTESFPHTRIMGWDPSDESVPQSIFAAGFATPVPFAYGEMSPSRGGGWQPNLANPRSPYQRGTRVVLRDGVSGAVSALTGLLGLSVTPRCQSSGAVVAYHSQTGILSLSRNLTALVRFLMDNLRIFGPERRFGFQIDLTLNYGAPMTSTSAPTLPSTTDANIAWFDILPAHHVSLGALNADWDNSLGYSSLPTKSLFYTSTEYPYPTFNAAAIGTCASGRRVISEQLSMPQGQPLTSAVKVIVAAPQFGGLIITRPLYSGLKAWTNITCYTPSENSDADVSAMGGISAFRHAMSINHWSSHPLKGFAIKSVDLYLCYARGSSQLAAPNFPTFTIHPDSYAGGGTYPKAPATTGGISTSHPTTLSRRSIKIRLAKMARSHEAYGSVVPIYIATTNVETASAMPDMVVLGSGAITDFLLIADSNSGRLGFVPAQPGISVTPLFATTSTTYVTNVAVGTTTPTGGLSSPFLSHVPTAIDGDVEGECSAPIPCSESHIYIRALNVCADPQCGSWIKRYNMEDNTCSYDGGVITAMVIAVLIAIALEVSLHWAFVKEFARLEGRMKTAGKKEV